MNMSTRVQAKRVTWHKILDEYNLRQWLFYIAIAWTAISADIAVHCHYREMQELYSHPPTPINAMPTYLHIRMRVRDIDPSVLINTFGNFKHKFSYKSKHQKVSAG